MERRVRLDANHQLMTIETLPNPVREVRHTNDAQRTFRREQLFAARSVIERYQERMRWSGAVAATIGGAAIGCALDDE
jgi:hypothetical protein